MSDSRVFISYWHDDKVWKDKLVTLLDPLMYQGELSLWSDADIRAGEEWEQAIFSAIDAADVAVLLVSPESLSSKYIHEREVPRLLERQEEGSLQIVPVILRPCLWNRVAWLSKLQVRPRGGAPLVTESGVRDTDFLAVAAEIADLVQARGSRAAEVTEAGFLRAPRTATPPIPPRVPPPIPMAPPVATPTWSAALPILAFDVVRNGWPGLSIRLPGAIGSAAGLEAQLVARFFFAGGGPLRANPNEALYRDTYGCVATGTPPFPIVIDPHDVSSFVLWLPYYSFNLQPTGGQMTYSLATCVDIFVGGRQLGRSPQALFTLRW
ncbi:MAG: toll/interleukin-1 receptor domain-containing protein [Vicinamibacterales bacterium]